MPRPRQRVHERNLLRNYPPVIANSRLAVPAGLLKTKPDLRCTDYPDMAAAHEVLTKALFINQLEKLLGQNLVCIGIIVH